MRLGLEAGAHTLDVAVELGVRGVPISADKLAAEGVVAALAPLTERQLHVCQIGAFGYNPLSLDAARREAQGAMLQRAIPLAAETGCPYVVICGGNYDPSGFGRAHSRNYTSQALDEAARELEPLCRLAERHGAYLSIEAYLKTAIHSAERFLELQRKIGSPALRCNVDVTSLYDYADMFDPLPLAQRTCEALAGHYGLGHIKEVALADGFHIHIGLAPLGQGPTDWVKVLGWMAPHLPADSWLILEHVATPEEARASVAYLRAAAAQAGVGLE